MKKKSFLSCVRYLVYPIAEHLQRRVGVVQDNGLVIVGDLSLWLCVDPDHVTVVPNLFQQL